MEVLICPVQIIDCYNYGDFAQMIEKAQIYDKNYKTIILSWNPQ